METVAETTQQRKDFALLIARRLAELTYPDERKRIDRGYHIVLQDQVTVLDDGTALVEAQCQTGHQYTVNGRCTCLDTLHNDVPGGRCKHVFAVKLARLVERLMTRQWIAQDCDTGQYGIATEVWQHPTDLRASAWVFQAYEDPTPYYVPFHGIVVSTRLDAAQAA